MTDKWQETTLRKGTKTPKICRDMFITDSRGSWAITEVSNGKKKSRTTLTKEKANELIKKHDLRIRGASAFYRCYTFRTKSSWTLIDWALNER